MKDTAKGTQSSAQYSLTLHNEWENATPGGTTRSPEQFFQLTVPATNYSGTNGEDQVIDWTFFDATASTKATLGTHFSGGFKNKDWLNLDAGFKFETESSLEIKAEYHAHGYVSLQPGQIAHPGIGYFITTKHQLVDHFLSPGFDPNDVRPDKKWEQSVDLPIPVTDTHPAWRIETPGVRPQ